MAAALALGQADPAAPAPPGSTAAAPSQTSAPAVSTTAQDVLEQPSTVRPFEMPVAAPPGPVPYADASDAKIPVKVEDYHRSYEGPENAVEAYYDAGVRRAFEAEQALCGALDGMWTLTGADGAPLMQLAISDPGEGRGAAGGAWRDLSRANDPDATGLIDAVTREGRVIVIRMTLRAGGPAVTLRLTPGAEGRWRGTLAGGAAADRLVVMERKAL
jgi:hypothetical protein